MKAKGWGIPGRFRLSTQDCNVDMHGVCSCKFRKKNCMGRKSCAMLGSDGGEHGKILILRRLMGKKFPKVWGERLIWNNMKQLIARSDKLDEFRHVFFKKCVPLTVEIKKRKI